MTASYLTTDIVVIIVLIVVLVLVGVCAFLIHFYWTKIGVAEIWNTTKWSSMRSSFYRTIGRLSRASTSKSTNERPFSGASNYSDDTDEPAPANNKRIKPMVTSYITPPPIPPSENPYRQNSNKSVSSIAYNNPVRTNYATKIGQPLESTKIYNMHEYDDNRYNNDLASTIQKQRF